MRPSWLKHPVFDPDGAHFRIAWKFVNQRSEWFRPAVCQTFHQCNALRTVTRD
jgi:hypothetical protein